MVNVGSVAIGEREDIGRKLIEVSSGFCRLAGIWYRRG